MPREPSIAESAKQRSLRVPLDHYERPDRLVRIKWLLSAAAALVAAAYFGWLIVGGRASHEQVSPGPVAGVHAAWNDDCQACHRDFQPLRSDAVSLAGLIGGKAAHRESLDQSCIKCHDEPVHHAAARPDEVPSCAACHREHQGSAADIVRPSDKACMDCHREIDHHRTGPSRLAQPTANVTGFGLAPQSGKAPHPEFRSLGSDPGNIKFNHWLHLQPGIAVADAKQKLKDAKTGNLVQLDCKACHQPDSASGASMQPIAFEQHCRACHPLQSKVAESQPAAEVPHGLSAERLTAVLDGLVFAAEQRQQTPQPPSPDESGEQPLIPGKTLGKNLAQKISQDVLARRVAMARAISAKCQECHYTRASNDDATELPDLLPANVSAAWLRHARFDHSAHRHVECRVCHQDAFAYEQRDKPQFIVPSAGDAAARDDQQVMIAGLESCAKCHAPARGDQGGARHDCAECHNYHGGDLRWDKSPFRPGGPAGSSPDREVGVRESEKTLKRSEGPTPGIASAVQPALYRPFGPLEATIAVVQPRSYDRGYYLTALRASAPFAGASSCAASGCHGSVEANAPAWQTAFTKWAAADPHARAYDVLWTFRAREMTRLLDRATSDQQHRAALLQRCIGCHATPPAEEIEASAEAYALGVQCESCHGPAGGWLHTHDRAGFSRASAAGFIDTKSLSQRAGACMGCHVGPNDTTGQSQAVDHDLIAAGHPRLTFEFHSYFQTLPAHWNREVDEAKHPGTFHYRSWLAGQTQTAEQRKLLNRDRSDDFAQLDCFACHHQLAGASWRQRFKPELLSPIVWPQPALLDSMQPELPASARLALARTLLLDAVGGDASWDAAVQAYLAARAITGDVTREAYPQAQSELAAVNAALAILGQYLSNECFSAASHDNRLPTQYDSPTEFAPGPLAERIQPVSDALQRVEAKIGPK